MIQNARVYSWHDFFSNLLLLYKFFLVLFFIYLGFCLNCEDHKMPQMKKIFIKNVTTAKRVRVLTHSAMTLRKRL